MTKKTRDTRPLVQRDLTEEQVSKFERETVLKLIEVLPVWHQQLGPGLDMVCVGLANLVAAADKAAEAATNTNATEREIRWTCTQSIAANLAVPKLAKQRVQRAARIRALGGQKKAASELAYEAHSLSLIAADFIDWYDEVGIGGLLRSILELVKVYGEIFHGHLDDPSLERDKVFFVSAFELRQRFDKVPKEMLEALEMLAKTQAEEPVTA